jgi:2-oxoglutarate dehydrogenase E2 component (dihydrolipoamide succinyltransferase)
MPVNIVVPSFGESITEGTVAQWLKKEGEFVQKDDILLEVESEKATQGIPSPTAGVLHISAKEGDKVEVGAVLGAIDETASAPKTKTTVAPKTAEAIRTGNEKQAAVKTPAAEKEPKLSPAARRVAAEEAIDVSNVSGTGRHGVILKENVEQHVEDNKEPPPMPPKTPIPPAADREKRVPMSAIRQRIAERLLTSQKSTASLTTFNEVDMSAVMELRSRYKDSFKEKHGVNLGFLSFFVKASIEALKAYPLANAAIDGRDIVFHRDYNIGVAVSTEKGLMVPILRQSDKMSFADIEKAIAELAAKARDGKIMVDDLQGGTFTITNGGIFGSMLSTPILNFPQSAILGMHAIQKRPVVRDDQIVIRPMMYVALTYDHRLIDGKEAVLFLVRIKECIEDPQRLLLEI